MVAGAAESASASDATVALADVVAVAPAGNSRGEFPS
jgi:hypothetical protein